MSLKKLPFDFWKFLISWTDRNFDWWTITLIPIWIILVLDFILYLRGGDAPLIIILSVEQLLAFCVVLSSTDWGLRSKLETRNKMPRMAPAIIVGIAFTLLITFFSFREKIILSGMIYVYGLCSVVLSYISLRSYDINPNSLNLEPDLTEEHVNQEKKDEKLFEPENFVQGKEMIK